MNGIISEKYTSLEYVHDIEWWDVFAVWRAHEAYQDAWQQHWKEGGLDSWDEWRKKYVAPIDPEKKRWSIYKIKDPHNNVKNFYGVPSRGWSAKCYDGEPTKLLAEILNHSIVTNNDKVKAIMKDFPHQTMLMGIVHDERIVLVEGMHRALALAKMEHSPEGDVVIALAKHEGKIVPIGKGNNY